MTINVPLFRKVLEYLTEHPDELCSAMWAKQFQCGTAGCIAYHTLAMLGYTAVFDGSTVSSRAESPDGRDVAISAGAADALGLDGIRSCRLFDACNDLADLWRLAAEFTDGEIAVPDEFRDADVSAKIWSVQ